MTTPFEEMQKSVKKEYFGRPLKTLDIEELQDAKLCAALEIRYYQRQPVYDPLKMAERALKKRYIEEEITKRGNDG